MRDFFCLITVLALTLTLAVSTSPAGASDEACIGCHGISERLHPDTATGFYHGGVETSCAACHGASDRHRSRPTLASPDNSFGPRWTATTAEQDGRCLACHDDDVAAHWNEALHMVNNVTCVSCHDVHKSDNLVLDAKTQAQVCTTCHKTQKSGVHGKPGMLRMNPACTRCHNPHADQRPQGVMLANDSAGCRHCHKLDAMAGSDKVPAAAKSYHRTMDAGDHTCIDCHQGVAHGDTEAVEPFRALAQSQKTITLFSPGQSDSSWLLTEHRGSQPLRQGTGCQQCHRGEEAAMGAALGQYQPSSRQVDVRFETERGRLVVKLAWDGERDDADIALMWGFGVNPAFRRGGCWAACHSDLPGMTLDRGGVTDKYLMGSGADTGEQASFAELWRIGLQEGGRVDLGLLLDGTRWLQGHPIKAEARYADGGWRVRVERPLEPGAPLGVIAPDRNYTFGIALHGGGRPGAGHWVSLPLSLELEGSDTDFRAD